MPLTCPRCSRVSPPEAMFCYADGASLGNVARPLADPARQRFPMPFVFPSGKPCHSFDELALACLADWDVARGLLADGSFAAFLAGVGRADLGRTARQAASEKDLDGSLDALLRQLPSSVLQPPRLVVEPSGVNLGQLRPGKDVWLQLRLENQGMGLLTGTVSTDTPWLLLGTRDASSPRKVFRFQHEAGIPVHISGAALRAGNLPFEGALEVESNGGNVTVPVCFTVPIVPFEGGVLTGAKTPRQIAEKAKAHPREAGELFASGAVARWYAANGWSYPVQEPAASGVAAVQQFFEALGLTRPPKVAINRGELYLEGKPGEQAAAAVEITSDEKRPVWASVVCDAAWLDVREVEYTKRGATLRLGTRSVPDCPGEALRATVTITSNGRQRFTLPVSLDVRGRPRPLDVVEEVRAVPPPPPRPVRRRSRGDEPREPAAAAGGGTSRLLLAALPVLLLCLGLSVTLGRDLGALMSDRGGPPPPKDDLGDLPQVVHLAYHDKEVRVMLAVGGSIKPSDGPGAVNARPAIWEPSMRFGLTLRDGAGAAKKLTFEPDGRTNNCVVRLDNNEWLFGERPFRSLDGQYAGNWPGRWQDRTARLERPLRDGRRSVWTYDDQRVEVTQTVGLLPGAQTGRIDTCLVHYRIENRDLRPHRVGLRFLLDTYIGSNDGVPFLIPGQQQLCSTTAQFNRPEDVPDFIQACERGDLANPGTVAQVQLRLAGLEPPARVTLGSWPNPSLNTLLPPPGFGRPPRCRQEKTLWDVPVLPIKTLREADSAVVIYWAERELEPGGHREMGFAYGLGTVSAGETQGQLALTVGGSFVPNGEFTLTAYVRNPVPGQSLRLTLPEGFTLVQGSEVAGVPPLPADRSSQISPVTWRVKAGGRTGTYPLKVQSSTGVSQTQDVRIQVRGIFGN